MFAVSLRPRNLIAVPEKNSLFDFTVIEREEKFLPKCRRIILFTLPTFDLGTKGTSTANLYG